MKANFMMTAILLFFMSIDLFAINSPEEYKKNAEKSAIKAEALVEKIQINMTKDGLEKRQVFFKLKRVFFNSKGVPDVFTGYCFIVPRGSKALPDDVDEISFFKPKKGDRVFVTVEKNGGEITSYTLMRPWLEKALEKYPQKITYALGRAVADDGCDKFIGSAIELKKHGKYAQALKKLEEVASINPDYKIIYNLRGEIYFEMKKYKKALENYDKALKLDGSYSEVYYNKGKTYTVMGDLKNAVASFEKAVECKPGDYRAFFAKGVCLLDLKQYREALECFDKTLLLKPNSVNALLQKGRVLNYMKEYSKAIKILSRAAQINPNAALVYYQRGVSYRSTGEFKDAEVDFRKYAELNPKDPSAFLNLAYISYINRNYKDAVEDCDKALKIDPKLVNAYYYRGGSYLNLGFYGKATEDFSKIAELEPENHAALGKLAMSLYIVSKTKEDYANAEMIFKKALALNPDGKFLPLWVYLCERKQGKINKTVLETALSKMPAKEWMANIYKLYLNKISAAECLRAILKYPESKREGMKCEAFFYIAELAMNNGDAKRAAEYFERCAKTKADNYLEHMMAKIELDKLKKQKN